MEVCVKQKIR
jgi:hypothetical protein